MKTSFNKLIIVISVIVISIGGYYLIVKKNSVDESPKGNGTKVTIYKSPTCGCCLGHASYLENEGFDVETVAVSDTSSLKEKYNIPYNMQSCHTAVIGDYFVEGHVPVEGINKLLEEKPDIDGIALPDMPAGSPGMPGIKSGDFVIYSLLGGETEEFVRL